MCPLQFVAITGLPVIASNWSGHVDFLSEKDSILLGGELKQVPKSVVWKDIIVEQSQWFVANENQTYKALNYTFEEYKTCKK